jgi:phospho-N-acetylmuramoyl-pentapeptide-transferase
MTGIAVAFCMAVTASVVLGEPILNWLRASGVRQTVSADAPERHAGKQGTPTMGGLIILAGAGVALAAIWTIRGASASAVVAALTIVGFAAVGALDDRLSLRRGSNLGLRAREKFGLQVVTAAVFTAVMAYRLAPHHDTSVLGVGLGVMYWPLAIVFMVGLSNATNLTDGLDGLTAGCSAIAYAGIALLLAVGGQGALAMVAAVMSGSCVGLLWFNAHPAQVFMGDTGSLAVGAGLAVLGILGKDEVRVIVATLPFWAETVSVMIQVTVFKWRRRRHGVEYARTHRMFRRAPLHHHFEECGYPEPRIVVRFWTMTAVATALAMVFR